MDRPFFLKTKAKKTQVGTWTVLTKHRGRGGAGVSGRVEGYSLRQGLHVDGLTEVRHDEDWIGSGLYRVTKNWSGTSWPCQWQNDVYISFCFRTFFLCVRAFVFHFLIF